MVTIWAPKPLGATFSWWYTNKGADTEGRHAGVPYDGKDPALRDFYLDNQQPEPGVECLIQAFKIDPLYPGLARRLAFQFLLDGVGRFGKPRQQVIEHRNDEQGQRGGENQATEDHHADGCPALGAGTGGNHQRHSSEDG